MSDPSGTLAPNHLPRILQLVDLGRWGTSASVFVLAFEHLVMDPAQARRGGYVVMSQRDVAMLTAVSRGTARRALDQLVAQGVLRRWEAAGQRGHAYQLDHEIGHWSGVPWRQKMTAWEAKARVLQLVQEVPVGADQGVVARLDGPQGGIVASGKVATTDGLSRASEVARSSSLSARTGARQGPVDPTRVHLSYRENNPQPPDQADPSDRQSLVGVARILHIGIANACGGEVIGARRQLARIEKIAGMLTVDQAEWVAGEMKARQEQQLAQGRTPMGAPLMLNLIEQLVNVGMTPEAIFAPMTVANEEAERSRARAAAEAQRTREMLDDLRATDRDPDGASRWREIREAHRDRRAVSGE